MHLEKWWHWCECECEEMKKICNEEEFPRQETWAAAAAVQNCT